MKQPNQLYQRYWPLITTLSYLLICSLCFLLLETIFTSSEFLQKAFLNDSLLKSALFIFSAAGLLYMLLYHKNSKLKKLQEHLHQHELKYRTLLETASEGIIIVDQTGRIRLVNATAETLFGYQQAELLSQSIETLLPEALQASHCHQRTAYIKDPQKRPMGRKRELLAKRKDNSLFPVEIGLSPFKMADETLIMSFIIDITTRKETEAALQAERDRAQLYLDIAGVMIIVIDINQQVILVNKEGCHILGYQESEIVHRNWFDTFIPGHSQESCRMAFREWSRETIAPPEYTQYPILTRTGEERMISWRNRLLKDARGNILGTLNSGQDITEQLRSREQALLQEKKLIQADKMATLGILVSGVAHEINNPNNYILLNGKIISRVWNDVAPIIKAHYQENGDFLLAGMPYSKAREKIGQLISGVSEGARRIQKILDNLKDFARQDTGDINQLVCINAIVESAIIIINNLIQKSTGAFSVEYGKKIPRIHGNFQQLEQVAINLLTNACQALKKRGNSLKVSTAYDKAENRVILKVIDKGIGMPKEDLERIMDPFFTTKRNNGGTGLGLSISYNIIKDHDGSIFFESDPGKGTTATVVLPVRMTSVLEGRKNK